MATDEPEASFSEFVAHRWAALYRTAYLLTGNHGDAEEILQATLVKAYAAWPRVAKADSPEAYVRRMLINGFVSGHRRMVRGRQRDEVSQVSVPPHDSAVLDRLSLWARVKALPPRQRAVIVLRYYEDMTERQIADTLGCSPGTVKSQASDALRTLRGCLGSEPKSERTLR